MKKYFYIFLFLISALVAKAQPYGNEWINYSQKYYKIKITSEGMYRLDSNLLASSGIDVSAINPKNFQLFGRGKEVPLYIEGELDGKLNSNDFIEFHGIGNDGWLDSAVYENKTSSNPYYSLFNDTAIYFLTWNTSTGNKRFINETDTSFSSYNTIESYFMKRIVNYYSAEYFEGETNSIGGTNPKYVASEGWFDSPALELGQSKTYTISTPNVYSDGPLATMQTAFTGASRNYITNLPDHHIKVEYKNAFNNWISLADTFFLGYQYNKIENIISPVFLNSGGTEVKITSITEADYISNRTAVSFFSLYYPHTYTLEGNTSYTLNIPHNINLPKSKLEISNFNDLSSTVWLYDLTNNKRIVVEKIGSNYYSLVPNSGNGSEKNCYLTSENNISKITKITSVGTNGAFTDFNSLAADSAFLIVANPKLMVEATNYKAYRASAAGGSNSVILTDINELYDQFAYGIMKNPLAIKSFANFTLDTYPSAPKNLFLFGKSIHSHNIRKSVVNYNNSLVPSFGNPSSDNLLTAGINIFYSIMPEISTGRLAAATPIQAQWYLDKVIDFEDNPHEEWMKNVLHFGGGSTASEQLNLKAYLKAFEDTIEKPFFGGIVTSFLKTSSAPIQINSSDTLKKLIENGVSLLTFFGHASGTGFDQSIDNPRVYNNKGKYPFLLANSCYAGDLHSTGISSSEDFVLLEEKGVIGYLASVSLGVPFALDAFSRQFYSNISNKNYGKSVGSSIQKSIQSAEGFNSEFVKIACMEMTLHGDPSIVINSHAKPDYAIKNKDVIVDASSDADSISVFIVATNIGKAIRDSFEIQVERIFPAGNSVAFLKRVPAPFYKDTFEVKMPIDFTNGIGLNWVKVKLDYFSVIDELNEFNNATTSPDISFIIPGGTIIPVYPYKHAIIPNSTVTLKASTADIFASLKSYIFQLDTTDAFTSPIAFTAVSSTGGVVEWTPPITLSDSTVYYWRVSAGSGSTTNYEWKESSFQYIKDKTGWGQSHFYQFKNNEYTFVKYNRANRLFEFFNDVKTITAKNGIYPYTPWNEIFYKVNGATKHIWTCAPNGFSIVVFDPISAEPWEFDSVATGFGPNGNFICVPSQTLAAFDFFTNDVPSRTALANFINSIPAGYRVLAYSQLNHSATQFDNFLYTAFESLGSAKIRSLQDTTAFILWGVKGGAIGSATEVVGDSIDETINFTDTIITNWDQGTITSELIGPAKNWGSFHWKYKPLELPSQDSVVVRLTGINTSGQEVTLANFDPASADVLNLSTYVDAQLYPYIKLKAFMKDDSLRTSPQFNRWQVLYTPVPEAALNPSSGYTLNTDTLPEGDNLKITMPIKNISDYNFTDSLLITYWIEDENRNNTMLPSKLKWPPLEAGKTITDTITINTEGISGNNSLWIEVNPLGNINSQLEQYHFNNIARISFVTTGDKTNPLLDVTFDGQHILNGDIVSSKPNILIQLKDENKFLALNDTSDFAVFLTVPGNTVAKRIYFGSELSFTSAVLPNNSAKINFTPQLLIDGTYQLLVQAKDRSSNESGNTDYKINFEVVNKSTITNVLNYPNPFSTSTKFVFTLTGSEIPTNFKIQILTVTGKVVKEIAQDELGSIHIGRNISEYAWNGKDEFGDQLANGIYLYRIMVSLNGSSIEKRETTADKFFVKEFGKMYLLR